eukprot:g66067.t1
MQNDPELSNLINEEPELRSKSRGQKLVIFAGFVLVALLTAFATNSALSQSRSTPSTASHDAETAAMEVARHGKGQNSKGEKNSFAVSHAPTAALVFTSVGAAGTVGRSIYLTTPTDLRLAEGDLYEPSAPVVGKLSAQFVVDAINYPQANVEHRVGRLQFTFGAVYQGDKRDEILVEGTGLYPVGASTFPVGSKLTRSITGGSGRYAGASGQCVSENKASGWVHVFYFTEKQDVPNPGDFTTMPSASGYTTTYQDRGSPPTYSVEITSSTAHRTLHLLVLYCVLVCSWHVYMCKFRNTKNSKKASKASLETARDVAESVAGNFRTARSALPSITDYVLMSNTAVERTLTPTEVDWWKKKKEENRLKPSQKLQLKVKVKAVKSAAASEGRVLILERDQLIGLVLSKGTSVHWLGIVQRDIS